jgi:hypothetical protein
MYTTITCDTNNFLENTKPKIVPCTNEQTGQLVFCLINFDTEESVDGYTPMELLNIRNSIDRAINVYCKPSDIKGQQFLWDYDLVHLTVPNSEV